MAYSKLHSSLVNSSLWCAPDPVRLLFVTMLAICDADGCVYGSRGGIARQANIDYRTDLRPGDDPFNLLMAPDPDSSDLLRHPENKGRRIVEIEGGFQIINYGFYRALRNADDRRLQNREAQRRFQAKKNKQNKPHSAIISRAKPRSAQAEAEAEAEAGKDVAPNGSEPTADKWFSELQASPAYAGIDVRAEFSKMEHWCKLHGKQPTQRRFLNWLNRADRPIAGNGGLPPRPMSAFEIEKRCQAISDEINKIFRANGGKRAEGDGIDALKARRDELKKQLTL